MINYLIRQAFSKTTIINSMNLNICLLHHGNKKKLLNEEFKSLGFYISDHPLNEYVEVFKQLNIISYDQFIMTRESEGLVAGTIMSIQEKKVHKRNSLRNS